MQGTQRFWRSVVAGMVVGLIVAGTTPAVQAASNLNPGVLPVSSHAYGATYGEWSARWLQWAFSIPVDVNPILDETGANCAEGQTGPVWFLAGTFGSPTTRDCTVPAGKALFFPLVNGIFGAAVFDCEPTVPGVPCEVDVLRTAAAASMDAVLLEASIDGTPLQNLTAYRVQSPVFPLTLPEDNVFGDPSGTYTPQVADGYWLMLAPLSAGVHTLHWKAEVTGGVFTGAVIEVIYHLTVGP